MKGMNRYSWTTGLPKVGRLSLGLGRAVPFVLGALVLSAGLFGLVAHRAGGGITIGTEGALARAEQLGDSSAMASAPDEVMELLEERRKKAEEQEKLAEEAQRKMELLKDDIAKRIEALSKERKELEKLAEVQKEKEEANLVLLAKSLAETPPEQAGVILGELNADLAASILKRMNNRKAGRVWGHIEADKAAAISRALASRGGEEEAKRLPVRRKRPKLMPPPMPFE